jgi:hypothetical protein
LHENAPAHRALTTQKKLAYQGFQYLDPPPYSPDLSPSDDHLFPGLEKQLKGRHFSSNAEIIATAETHLQTSHHHRLLLLLLSSSSSSSVKSEHANFEENCKM